MSYLHSIPKSFVYAWSGIWIAFKNEPNFRIHALATLVVVILGLITKVNALEWAILVVTIGIVISLELINTCLEALVNLASPKMSEGAKIAKDTAAAAVMIGALISIAVGILIFVPKIF